MSKVKSKTHNCKLCSILIQALAVFLGNNISDVPTFFSNGVQRHNDEKVQDKLKLENLVEFHAPLAYFCPCECELASQLTSARATADPPAAYGRSSLIDVKIQS